MHMRGIALDAALDIFVSQTGLAVAYDPTLVEPEMVFCTAEALQAEDVLKCILKDTGLDYVRLSSGTYVILPAAELAPIYGFLGGRVVDRTSGSPLAYAHISLSGVGIGTVTNDAGQFVLPRLLPGSYAVSVSHVGYRKWVDTLVVAAGRRTETRPALQSEPVSGRPIVVTGASQRFSTRMQSGVADITIEEAGWSTPGGHGPLQASLARLAGVQLNDATSEIHVQGAATGEHRFELDGVPVYSPFYSLGYIGPFSPLALEKITVHKAGYGAEEGSLIGGLISATHRVEGAGLADAVVDPLGFNAALRGTSGEGEEAQLSGMLSARVGMPNWPGIKRAEDFLSELGQVDPFLVFAPVRVSGELATDKPSGPIRSEELSTLPGSQPPELSYADLHGAARVKLGPLKTLSVSGYHGRTSISGGLLKRSGLDNQLVADPPPLSIFDSYDAENTVGQIRYDAVLGTRFLWSTQLRGSRYGLDHRYMLVDSLALSPSGEVRAANLETTRINDVDDVSEWGLETVLEWAGGRHDLKVGLEMAATDSRFSLLMAGLPPRPWNATQATGTAVFSVVRSRLTVDELQTRLGGFVSDRFTLGRFVAADAGLRLTYLPSHEDVFAEPRAALHVEGATSGPVSWSLSSAAGLYRQFLGQYDVSALNAGALLPSARVWLPVGESVRPPLAYHASKLFRISVPKGWNLSLEGYAKWIPHGLTLDYAMQPSRGAHETVSRQFTFLTSYRGRARGLAAGIERRTEHMHLLARYERSKIVRKSPRLYSGEEHSVPWEEPHRIDVSLDWEPVPSLQIGGRWQGIWGRSWAFKQAYYDYFGHRGDTRDASGFDLGNPSAHTLPAFIQLDVSLGYSFSVGDVMGQARIDVLNALARSNVLDWRLIPVADNDRAGSESEAQDVWEIRERYWYGRIPTVSLRLSL